MTGDIFDTTKRLVSARSAAEYYGFQPNRANFISCPFHIEKTASLKLFDDGGWHCFGCNQGGSSVNFVAKLLNLSPLDAVRRMNEDFHLGLPLDKPPSKEQQKAAQRQREIRTTSQNYEQWRSGLIRQLNACFCEGHLALKSLETPVDLDRLTDAQAFAVKEQARFEWLSDTLTYGTMAQQMEIFRERREVEKLCSRVLNSSPMKSNAA